MDFIWLVLRRDLINEKDEAPSDTTNHDENPHYYDGPFDFTFFRREPDNFQQKLWIKSYTGPITHTGNYSF